MKTFLTTLVLLPVTITFAYGQKAVEWPEWRWKPQDKVEVQKILDGKKSKKFRASPTMRRAITQFKKEGYTYFYLVDVTLPRETERRWRPYLSKKWFKTAPTAEAVQATMRFEIAVTWTGKYWDFYVGPGDNNCP